MAKIWKTRASLSIYPATTFHKIYIDISLCMGYPAGELLVLGWEVLVQALCHSSTVLEAFKGPKIYALQIHGLTLEFEVHASNLDEKRKTLCDMCIRFYIP